MSDDEFGRQEFADFTARWGPAKGQSVLEEWAGGKPFFWFVTARNNKIEAKGGADTLDSARQAALEAVTDRQGPETEALIRQDLAAHEREHGPFHLSVAQDLNRLFLFLMHPNRLEGGPLRLEEAETVIRRALAVTEEASGRRDENYARVLLNLGFVLEVTDREAQAREAYSQAARILAETLGADHPNTQEARNLLAKLGQG